MKDTPTPGESAVVNPPQAAVAAAPLPPEPARAPVGRPSLYSPDMLIKANEYIASAVDTPDPHIAGKIHVKIPKAAGLALYLGVNKTTLYEWKAQFPEFSTILDRINAIQEDRVLDRAMDGTYNPTIAKLLLGKHGYKDQQDVTTNDKDITPENQSAANAAIAAFLKPKNDAATGTTSAKPGQG